jgi:hypothetical protein
MLYCTVLLSASDSLIDGQTDILTTVRTCTALSMRGLAVSVATKLPYGKPQPTGSYPVEA